MKQDTSTKSKTDMEEELKIITGKKILIVEDDQFISRVYTKWLTKYGTEIVPANNGALGLELLSTNKFDLVLLDLGMPGLDGYKTLMQIRKNAVTKDVPVIILSNTTMTENRDGFKEIRDAGVENILRKYETSLQNLVDSIVEVFRGKSINSLGK